MRHVADIRAQGNIFRARVGNHRLIYRLYEPEQLMLPLYLSERPRQETTYRDWEAHATAIAADFEARQYDRFHRWPLGW